MNVSICWVSNIDHVSVCWVSDINRSSHYLRINCVSDQHFRLQDCCWVSNINCAPVYWVLRLWVDQRFHSQDHDQSRLRWFVADWLDSTSACKNFLWFLEYRVTNTSRFLAYWVDSTLSTIDRVSNRRFRPQNYWVSKVDCVFVSDDLLCIRKRPHLVFCRRSRCLNCGCLLGNLNPCKTNWSSSQCDGWISSNP